MGLLPKGELIACQIIGIVWNEEFNRTRTVRELPVELRLVYFLKHVTNDEQFIDGDVLAAIVNVSDAKAAGIEGTVKVFAQINRSGRVDLLWVVSGPEQLREAALQAVKSWIYCPYSIDGRPADFAQSST